MTTQHLSQVLALWQETEGLILTYSDNVTDLTRYFSSNPQMSHVAFYGERLVGAVLCGHDGRRGYLHHLAVDSHFRGQGIGKLLVDACLRKLKLAEIHQCNLFIVDDNNNGRQFWEKYGFSVWPNIRLMSKNLNKD